MDAGGFVGDSAAGAESQPHYAQVVISLVEHAPLLADPRLARLAVVGVEACRAAAPGSLWAYLVLPHNVRAIIGPARADACDDYVALLKTQITTRLLPAILRADDESLDVVLRFSPVWGGAIYRVWDAGYHKAAYWTEYRLSNAVYSLQQLPVTLGLVSDTAVWPYVWVGG